MRNNIIKVFAFTIACFVTISCGHNFLEVKPNKKMVIPSSILDIQALLDNSSVFNASTPYLGEIGSDDYYVTDDRWNALSVPPQKNAYIWAKDVYEGYEDILDWVLSYERIFYANLALESIGKIQAKNDIEKQELNYLTGTSLFLRSKALFEVAQLFCKPYDTKTSSKDLGIPVRLLSDLNAPIFRNTVKETYDQIVSDLETASQLLPKVAELKTRPNRAAAFAMLAKVHLVMFNYDMALKNATLCLQEYSQLIDYNTLNGSLNFPFVQFNDEVIFHSTMGPATILNQSRLKVDKTLFEEYKDNDLRKVLFFTKGNIRTFKGSYGGNTPFFTGLSTNEILLIRSECLVRQGDVEEGISVLNSLLKKRYQENTYKDIELLDPTVALQEVLKERRKELIFRGIRWSDLRRLNKEGHNITLERIVNQSKYELLPNDKKYVLPIPDLVIKLSSLEQNPR